MTTPSLHIIGGKKLGGAERFFVRLVNALARAGEEVRVVTVPGGEIDAAVSQDIPRHHAPLAGVWDIWSRLSIRRAIKRHRPAIVQTYMGRATRLTHLPETSATVHVARLGGFYNLKGYRHAHAWIGNTRGIHDYLMQQGLPAGRVFQIGNFVDIPPTLDPDTLSGLRQQWAIPDDALIILGLGRLHPNKGFGDLLQAFARLPATIRSRPVWLAMVGDGPLGPSLKKEAASLGIERRTIWAGWQYDPAPWYQASDLFVCSSRHEPLGNVILEAWANRVPIVSTRSEGALELLEEGVDGFLAEKADPVCLARVMEQALETDAHVQQTMIGAGRHKIDDQFSEAAIVDAYRTLYRRLTGNHGG